MSIISKFDDITIPESLCKSIEGSGEINNYVTPIKKQQHRLRQTVDSTNLPAIADSSPAPEAIKPIADSRNANTENFKVMQKNADAVGESLHSTSAVHALGEIAMKNAFSTYQFEIPPLKAIDTWSTNATANLATGLIALVTNPVMQEVKSISSRFVNWLQTVDFSPLTSILESIKDIGFDYSYKEVKEIFLKAMYDARWFPYAGWMGDLEITDALFEILCTSKVSKNRVKRIDKLIFSYYDKNEINNIKRRWRQKGFPSHITRILIQSVQAYQRREYALTVSALSTLWEGIIQKKMCDTSYRVSRKTRENLTKLIEENNFNAIISSFCEEFIFYDCRNADEVKPDVPGRHGIAHCWYDTYPNRKMALNAILFTEFLLQLKPVEKTEEIHNG